MSCRLRRVSKRDRIMDTLATSSVQLTIGREIDATSEARLVGAFIPNHYMVIKARYRLSVSPARSPRALATRPSEIDSLETTSCGLIHRRGAQAPYASCHWHIRSTRSALPRAVRHENTNICRLHRPLYNHTNVKTLYSLSKNFSNS